VTNKHKRKHDLLRECCNL